MTRSRWLIVGHLALLPVTAASFVGALLVTGFLACGISGCSGGGFGPSYSPVATQVGLVGCGATLLPLTLLVLRRQARAHLALASTTVVLSGALLAMVVLGLGPDGCPAEQEQARTGSGSATCSADDDALPADRP